MRLGTIAPVGRSNSRKDEALGRYFAYRVAVWKHQNPDTDYAVLAELLGVERPVLTSFLQGKNSSHRRVAAFAAAIGPQSEDEFKRLAKAWAEQYPHWKAEDPLPEPITHTGDPLESSPEGDSPVHSEAFREAARHLIGLARCSPDEARAAATLAWEQNQGLSDEDWYWWLGKMRDKLKQIQQGSGKRPSSRFKIVK